jgi:hypothetical protein
MRVNRDLGQRTVIGIMGIQKHQADRDLELLSLNSRFALHRDWTVQSQYVVDLLDEEMHWAYHLSTDWRHERGWGGEVRFEEIQDGFRPNEVGLEDEAFRKLSGDFSYTHRFAEGKLIKSYHSGVFYLYQTDRQHLLRERINRLFGGFDIGNFELFSTAGVGAQREMGRLFDTKFLGAELDYRATWGRVGLFNRLGTRQDKFSRYTGFVADVNLFGKLTTDLHLSHFFWRDHRSTFIFRLRSNYQFTKKVGWRIFVERVNERFEDEVSYNFNSIFDYEFTPESHFYFVFVDSTNGDKAVFTKMAYLFEH